jgi:hypothetical protein
MSRLRSPKWAGGGAHADCACEACRRSRSVPSVVRDILRSAGQPLQPQARIPMEARFGRDFSRVRLHTDPAAAASASAIGALAYASGHHVVLGPASRSLRTPEDRGLLAHELTHVVQGVGEATSHEATVPEVVEAGGGLLEAEAERIEQAIQTARPLPSIGTTNRTPVGLAAKPKGKSTKTAAKPKRLTFAEVSSLADSNSQLVSTNKELLLCLMWKESSFNPSEKSKSSTATGLMQLTRGAVQDVNANTPKGVHFTHAEMTNPGKNIECGTRYLELRIKWAQGSIDKALDGYGTGAGYKDNIYACQKCLVDSKSADPDPCLQLIHT